MNHFLHKHTLFFISFLLIVSSALPLEAKKKKKNARKIQVLLIDGQSKNHTHWKEMTPVLLKQLYDSRIFDVDVATSPMKGESLDKFNPKFRNYDVVVSIYNGDSWSGRVQRSLEKYVRAGGGFVVIHAANNAFPTWTIYNEMIGVGGWGNRNESAGPYVFLDDDGNPKIDVAPGNAGHYGPMHEYLVDTQVPDHPIMQGIPSSWLHIQDELYSKLRGPAKNIQIIASAYSSEKYEGSQRHEPVLMTIQFDKGRIFHSTMGHDRQAISCVGFMTTFVRGCEWAAGRAVSFEVPEDFPTIETTRSRTY